VWIATNTAGQGKWSLPVAFRAQVASFVYSNTIERTVVWDSESFDYGNNMSSTTFTAPAKGLYQFNMSGFFQGGGRWFVLNLYSSGNNQLYGATWGATVGSWNPFVSSELLYLTNNATVYWAVSGEAGTTNILGNAACSGVLIRELP